MTAQTCEKCGALVADLDEHLEQVRERRARYGTSWQLEARSDYAPIPDPEEDE